MEDYKDTHRVGARAPDTAELNLPDRHLCLCSDVKPLSSRAACRSSPGEAVHSEFTSIYQRIQEIRDALSCSKECEPSAQGPLMSFQSDPTHVPVLPYRFQDYLSLVDWTGRAIRDDKRGAIDGHLPPIIQRLNIDPDAWQLAMQPRGNVFGRAMGLDHLRLHAKTLGQSWIKGVRAAEVLYN